MLVPGNSKKLQFLPCKFIIQSREAHTHLIPIQSAKCLTLSYEICIGSIHAFFPVLSVRAGSWQISEVATVCLWLLPSPLRTFPSPPPASAFHLQATLSLVVELRTNGYDPCSRVLC